LDLGLGMQMRQKLTRERREFIEQQKQFKYQESLQKQIQKNDVKHRVKEASFRRTALDRTVGKILEKEISSQVEAAKSSAEIESKIALLNVKKKQMETIKQEKDREIQQLLSDQRKKLLGDAYAKAEELYMLKMKNIKRRVLSGWIEQRININLIAQKLNMHKYWKIKSKTFSTWKRCWIGKKEKRLNAAN
jgi:hypothetical protein